MKKTLAKTLRSALALVLALVMVLGTVGTTFAAEIPGDANAAVKKLIKVLEQYGPDVVEEARQYVDKHGYVEAVKSTAADLKAALSDCISEHEFMAAKIEAMLAGPIAQLKALKAQAENLVVLIALYKSGAFGLADSAAVITIPGFGTIDTNDIDLENFDVDDLTEEQKQAINDSGLLGDVKLEDLTDEQVDALKDAGLKGEIDPDLFTEEQLKDLQNAQNKLNETVESIEKTQETVNQLEGKLADMKAKLAALKEAAENTENLSEAIIAILKQETVQGAQLAKEKYIEARTALFNVLAGIEKPYVELGQLTDDIIELTVKVVSEIKDLSVFVATDVANTVSNNKLLFAGAFVLGAQQLGISVETLVGMADLVQETLSAAVEKVTGLVKGLKAKVAKAYKDATTADLLITYGTNYVAIGDAAAAADDSYVDLLNSALKIPYAVDKSMCEEGVMIQDTVLDEEAIANAELITLGYSISGFTADMMETVLLGGVDWSALGLPEVAVKAIDETMDEIDKYLEAFKVPGAEYYTAAIESIAYNAMVYAYELPATISAIRDINEDAVLVVVGLDNPLEGVEISYEGKTLSLDNLSEGLVALTDAFTLVYAVLANNCTFVATPSVANDLEGTKINEDNLAATLLSADLLPNAEGQEDICNYILKALNVEYSFLLGDADLDGQVTYHDALNILRHAVGLAPVGVDALYMPVCEVDGIEGISYNDALYVLRHAVGLDDKYPIEK